MIRIETTTDFDFIRCCITHPRIWPHVSCDGIDDLPDDISSSWFVEAIDGGDRLGVFLLHVHNPILVEIHTALLPSAWGASANKAAHALLRFLAEQGFKKAMTYVPSNNPLALRFARGAGMAQEGMLTNSYPKNGVLLDQHILGVCLCQQQ